MTEPITPEPITPSWIVPAGQPLPDHAPRPGDIPPWRTPPPAPPPPPAAPPPPPAAAPLPEPVPVHVTVVMRPEPEPEPEQPPWWQRVAPRITPWKAVAAVALPLVPMWPLSEYSAATTWAYTVGEARAMAVPLGYALAGGTLSVSLAWLIRTHQGRALAAVIVSTIGLFGAIHPYDLITWLTGVTP